MSCATTKSSSESGSGADGQKLSERITQTRRGDETVKEYDLNGDKRPDVWEYFRPGQGADGKSTSVLVRKELDLNWDGRVDMSRLYDDKGHIEREALDLDYDGQIDEVLYFEKGILVRKERDLEGKGKPSLFLYYEKGKLVRKERDSNADGRIDYWEYWENEQVDRIGEDLDADGNVDRWIKNPANAPG